MKKFDAIILARGGSKGLPNKNILSFSGHPLIAWTIIQAKKSQNISSVYLSSDSKKILEIGKKYGAKIIKRPKKIAGDHAKSEEALMHALKIIGSKQTAVLMLEPTAPLRQPYDIDECIDLFIKEKWDSGFSAAPLQNFLIWRKSKNKKLESINYDYKKQLPRQLRDPEYVENGLIYIFKPSVLKNYKNRFGGKVGIYKTKFWQSVEIDDKEDWGLVKTIFKHYLEKYYREFIV